MSAIRWAKSIRCDFPDCDQQAIVELDEKWPDRVLPEGWTDLRGAELSLSDFIGRPLSEFCPVHSRSTIGELVGAMLQARINSRET